MKFLSPDAALNLLSMAGKQQRPPQIVALQAEIAGDTRALELRSSMGGPIDQAKVGGIVRKKLELDGLLALWAEGKLE